MGVFFWSSYCFVRTQMFKVALPKLVSPLNYLGDRGNTVVKVLYYKSEGHWFDPSWCQWIFH